MAQRRRDNTVVTVTELQDESQSAQGGSRVAVSGRTDYPGHGHTLGETPMEVDGASGPSTRTGPGCLKDDSLVDSAPGPATGIDWQFYLDVLASDLSNSIDEIGIRLDIASAKRDKIRKDSLNEHEICFRILWAWLEEKKSTNNDGELLKKLHHELTEAGLTVLVEQGIPTRAVYQYKDEVCTPDKKITEIDVLWVAKRTESHTRLARYFGLDEGEIQQVVVNKRNNVKDQAQELLNKCIKRNLLKSRRQLCNGLSYIGNNMLADEINEKWKK